MRAIVAALLLSTTVAFAAERPTTWSRLTSAETTAITSALAQTKIAGTATIACAGVWCRSLSDSYAKTFTAAKWKVVRMNSGGLGIDGVAGIRIHPCYTPANVEIAKVLAAGRKSEIIEEKCGAGDGDIFVIVGSP